jgi:DNA-binding response OmpR family regulator
MNSILSKKRVLLIEDKKDIGEHIQSALERAGIKACLASSIQKAVSQMMISTFDVVALDADVEDAARLVGLLIDLRHAKNTLLLLFPIESTMIRTSFLRRGFDMCLPDNDAEECIAAIVSLLRRPSIHDYPDEATPPGRIIYKDLTIDPLRQKVTMGCEVIHLTALEFRLLYFLASNPSIVFTRDLIYERVWRENSLYGCKGVTDMVCSVRKKLGLSSSDSQYIKTIKGVGYCFAP